MSMGVQKLLQVIREGAPCHLYFDLEFATASNPTLQGEKLVESLLAMVSRGFR